MPDLIRYPGQLGTRHGKTTGRLHYGKPPQRHGLHRRHIRPPETYPRTPLGTYPGFTKRYSLKRLVWFETHETMETAIAREKQIKNWKRSWKLELIEKDNPRWRDLAEDLGFDLLPSSSSRA